MELRSLIGRWERFWFAPVDARSVAAMRISLGAMLILTWVQLYPDLDLLLGADGVMDEVLLRHHRTPWALTVDSLAGWRLQAFFWGGLAVLVAFTVGLGTRVANVLAALLLIGVWHRSPWIWNGGDRLLRIWTLTLCLVPSGAAWSVDAWLRGGRREVPILAHRLIVLQLCVMYLYTGLAKLSGPTWWDGTAIYWALSDASFSRAPALLDPLLQTTAGLWFCRLATWTTLVWEILFVPLVLFRPTRWPALAAGVVLHAGIFATMSVGMFGPASVWGYQAFLRWRSPPPSPDPDPDPDPGCWVRAASPPRSGAGAGAGASMPTPTPELGSGLVATASWTEDVDMDVDEDVGGFGRRSSLVGRSITPPPAPPDPDPDPPDPAA